jgi:4-hydroxy-3-polyprenylbenzoate decarboxylase
MEHQRIVVAITGASGSAMGFRLLQLLKPMDNIEVHLVMSEAGRYTLGQETPHSAKDAKALADVCHEPSQIGASLASGSFHHDGMIVLPCSIKSLSAIAHCHSGDLISRAADVTLKEGRPLLLAVRETPFHLGHLRLMTQASEMGAIIFPPILGFYSGSSSLEQSIDHLLGRMLQRLGIQNDHFKVWEGPKA